MEICRSEAIAELAKALSLAQAKMGPAIKDRENPFFKSMYADLTSVWEACRGPLTENGLCVTQLLQSEAASVKVTTILMHNSGQYIASELTMKAEKETPQGIGSATTYARRYALAAMVGISSGDDDDANSAEKKPAKKPEKKDEGASKPTESEGLDLVKKNIEKARKLIGDEAFFKVLGNEGLENMDQVTNVAVANQILRDMRTVYENSKPRA